jgi:hypothetical protein
MTAAANENLVTNGGFELGTGADADWTENAIGNTASIVRSSDSPYSGSYSMLATVNWQCGSANDNCDGADYQPDGRVDFEDLYYLSLFWLD